MLTPPAVKVAVPRPLASGADSEPVSGAADSPGEAFESVSPALMVPALSVVKRPALPLCTVIGSWLATVIRP